MKKFLPVLLSVTTILSVVMIPAVAENSVTDKPLVSQTELFFEKVLGGIGSVFGRVLNAVTFTDESVAERANAGKNGGIMTGTAGSLVPFAQYTYQWFDPVNGEYIEGGEFRASVFGTWFAPLRPDDTDMVLYISKK